MAKKTWVKPMTLVQKFEANETVASCLQVSCQHNSYYDNWFTHDWHESECNAPLGNKWLNSEGDINTGYWGNPFQHKNCKEHPESNIFIINGNDIKFSVEHSSQGTLSGGLDFYNDTNGNGSVDAGDIVYWHTEGHQGAIPYRWNHWGYLSSVDSSHPNRS